MTSSAVPCSSRWHERECHEPRRKIIRSRLEVASSCRPCSATRVLQARDDIWRILQVLQGSTDPPCALRWHGWDCLEPRRTLCWSWLEVGIMLVHLGVPWELQARGGPLAASSKCFKMARMELPRADCDIIGDILHLLQDGMDEIALSRDALPGIGWRSASCS